VLRVEKAAPGLTVLAAIKRPPHGRTVAQLEQPADPPAPLPAPPPPPVAPGTSCANRLSSRCFGILKEALGFRRFHRRGLEKVSLEWTLVTLAYNLKRLHCLGAVLQTA
jgi:hypothetical protein